MAQVLQRALDAGVTPRAIFGGHSQDQIAEFDRRGWPPRRTPAAGIVLLGDQPLMPIQERARGDDGGDLVEAIQADLPRLGGEPAALIIVESGSFAQLLLQHSDLLLEVFDDVLLLAVHPTGQAHKQKW